MQTANVTPVIQKGNKKGPGRYRSVSLTEKMRDQLIPETISRQMKKKKVTGNTQHGFMRGKSCLINLFQ